MQISRRGVLRRLLADRALVEHGRTLMPEMIKIHAHLVGVIAHKFSRVAFAIRDGAIRWPPQVPFNQIKTLLPAPALLNDVPITGIKNTQVDIQSVLIRVVFDLWGVKPRLAGIIQRDSVAWRSSRHTHIHRRFAIEIHIVTGPTLFYAPLHTVIRQAKP